MGQDWTPGFSTRKIGDGYFLANEFGEWSWLSPDEFASLSEGECSPDLYQDLADKALIKTADNEVKFQAVRKRWQSTSRGKDSQLVIVHLTQRCNLTCGYCHSSAIALDAKGRDLTSERAKRVIDFVGGIPKSRITIAFQGGEPALMQDEIAYICQGLLDHPSNIGKTIHFGITTNGTIQDDSFLALLRKYKIRTTISFDGPREVHDLNRTHRDGRGSYDEAIEMRKKLRSQNSDIASGAIMVLTSDTLPKLDEILDQYIAFGQFTFRLKPVTKLGRAKKGWNDHALSFEEFWEAYTHVHARLIELYRETGNIIIEHSCFTFIQKLIEKRNTGDVDTRNPCGIIDGVINLDVDGKVHACHEGKRKREFWLGMTSDGWATVTGSEKAREIRNLTDLSKISDCQLCAYRSYCTPCPAHNHQSFGDGQMRPNESWECRATLALGDLILSDFESNNDYYINAWREWQMQRNVEEALEMSVTG